MNGAFGGHEYFTEYGHFWGPQAKIPPKHDEMGLVFAPPVKPSQQREALYPSLQEIIKFSSFILHLTNRRLRCMASVVAVPRAAIIGLLVVCFSTTTTADSMLKNLAAGLWSRKGVLRTSTAPF